MAGRSLPIFLTIAMRYFPDLLSTYVVGFFLSHFVHHFGTFEDCAISLNTFKLKIKKKQSYKQRQFALQIGLISYNIVAL